MNLQNRTISIVSINMTRLICAYMVVAIHVHPFEEYSTILEYIFTQIIPRIAVPFFFLTSGYFYTRSLLNQRNKEIDYLKRLIFTYSVWSGIYIIFKLLVSPEQISFKSVIFNYFFLGTEYHLWYFPALIFCVIVSTIFYKIKKLNLLAITSIIFYFIGLLGCSYYGIGINIPFLNKLFLFSHFTLIRRVIMMGLPFFMAGYYVNYFRDTIVSIKNKSLIIIFIATVLLFILEIFTVNLLAIQENVIITIFLYLLTIVVFSLCLKNPLDNLLCLDNKFKVIANFTYYSHPIFITVISVIYKKLFDSILLPTPKFLYVIIFTTVGALILNKFNIKWINKIIS